MKKLLGLLFICVASIANATEPSAIDKQKPFNQTHLKNIKHYISERHLSKKSGVKMGMTTHEVRNHTNWGKPKSINRTVTANGKAEEWIYDNFQSLYFENGKLISVQTYGEK